MNNHKNEDWEVLGGLDSTIDCEVYIILKGWKYPLHEMEGEEDI